MVQLGPARFVRGSNPNVDPNHTGTQENPKVARLDHSFAIATEVVTLKQFQEFVEDTLARKNEEFQEIDLFRASVQEQLRFIPRVVRTEDSPISWLTRNNVHLYCNWVSERSGIPVKQWCYERDVHTGNLQEKPDATNLIGFRLPTVEEWEYACRAGTTTRRYFGHSDELVDNYGWYVGNSENRTWPVGLKKPNDFGLFDVYGNVWELCSGDVCLGGGSYDGGPSLMRSSQPKVAQYQHDGTGFRVVRTVK